MLTDVSQWEAAARAHGEFFAAIRPATTFVEVQGFINRKWLTLRLLDVFNVRFEGLEDLVPKLFVVCQ